MSKRWAGGAHAPVQEELLAEGDLDRASFNWRNCRDCFESILLAKDIRGYFRALDPEVIEQNGRRLYRRHRCRQAEHR